MPARIHVIGAGLAGLAAAVALTRAGVPATLYEAASFAGGRCRSYFDPTLEMRIDNGNHLVLSGNRDTLAYAESINAAQKLTGPDHASFPFVDLTTNERWTVRLSDSRIPWWIFRPDQRVPGTGWRDYLALGKLLRPGGDDTLSDRIACSGTLYDRLLQPLLLAALNTDPVEGSAALAATILRETLSAGGAACRPLVTHTGLSDVFVDPALEFLKQRKVPVHLGRRLRALQYDDTVVAERRPSVAALHFADESVALAADDGVVLALPAQGVVGMVPGVTAPDAFRSIVNAHYAVAPPPGCPALTGVIHGTAEWVFAFDDRLSVTISGADRLLDMPREQLAETIWRDVVRTVWHDRAAGAMAADAPVAMPKWQLVRERRATFAATPEQARRRAGTLTRWSNLFLAGDWTDTGLPATIEGAIRSGNRAAAAARQHAMSVIRA